MQFLIGALIAAAFFVLLFMAYTYGQMRGADQERAELLTLVKRPVTDDQIEEEKQRQKQVAHRKGFDEMMAYNEETARRGKG